VRDVTHYPPFQGVIHTLADLYERQHDPTYQPLLTYASPTSGQPVSTSFVLAQTWDEMEQRLRGERARCEFTYGLMGRLPDFMNAFVTDMAAIRTLLGRRMPQFADLPIIALTAKAMKGDRDKSIKAGASDYFPKPVETDHLLQLMRHWLRRSTASGSTVSGSTVSGSTVSRSTASGGTVSGGTGPRTEGRTANSR